jgi:hypothetical protein
VCWVEYGDCRVCEIQGCLSHKMNMDYSNPMNRPSNFDFSTCQYWDECFAIKACQGDEVLLEERFCYDCKEYKDKR